MVTHIDTDEDTGYDQIFTTTTTTTTEGQDSGVDLSDENESFIFRIMTGQVENHNHPSESEWNSADVSYDSQDLNYDSGEEEFISYELEAVKESSNSEDKVRVATPAVYFKCIHVHTQTKLIHSSNLGMG